MKKIIFTCAATIFISAAHGQDMNVVYLEEAKINDVIFATGEAVIYFQKGDILDIFAEFEKSYSFKENIDNEKQQRFIKAIEFLASKEEPLVINEQVVALGKAAADIKELIEIRIGAELLMKGKANLYRVQKDELQKKLKYEQLIDSPNGTAYQFLFIDSDKEAFFRGEIYGQHAVFFFEE